MAQPVEKCPKCGELLITCYWGVTHDEMTHAICLKGWKCSKCDYENNIDYQKEHV